MDTQPLASASIIINASSAAVWSALTEPEKVKQYLYGTKVETDWQPGSPIRFTGEWEGTAYVDKGEILIFEPNHRLQYTYLSSFTGLEDQIENYSIVTFELSPEGVATKLTVSQSNFKDETHRNHSQTNWEHVLGGVKKLLESNS